MRHDLYASLCSLTFRTGISSKIQRPIVNLRSSIDWKGHVCLVDDDLDVRTHLSEILHLLGHQVSTYESAEAFLARVPEATPLVLILDMRMPGLSGVQLHEQLVSKKIPAAVIYASGQSEMQEVVEAMKLGAVDFLLKPFTKETLSAAVAEGMRRAEQLSAQMSSETRFRRGLKLLSPREIDILVHLVDGRQNRHIAEQFQIRPDTVKRHRATICEKFLVADTADLIALAREVPREIERLTRIPRSGLSTDQFDA